jgi:hypothetical protein
MYYELYHDTEVLLQLKKVLHRIAAALDSSSRSVKVLQTIHSTLT